MIASTAGCNHDNLPLLETRRLRSLWEMIDELKVGEIVSLMHKLVELTSLGTDDKAPLPTNLRMAIHEALVDLLPHCERLQLDVPTQYILDCLNALNSSPRAFETGAMARSAGLIARTIEIQLRSRLFFVLQPDAAKLYNERRLLGPPQAGRFGEAASELDEAAKCLALGRSTASAFHSIRCLEAGIRAMSRCLQIPDPTRAGDRNWGAMLGKLKDKIDAVWPGSSKRMAGDGEFFDGAYAALATMQNPWRNATMHLDQKYTPEEAQHIFDIVRGFMHRIANRMDENGQPLA